MQVRRGGADDASVLAAISMEVWLGTYIKNGVSSFFADFALSEFTTEKLRLALNDPNEHFIVSENREGIDGFIRITSGKTAPAADCSDAEIATLYVQPRHHGKGIGKALLNAGFDYVKQSGKPSTWLTVNSENKAAIAFYEAQGFIKVGKTAFQINEQTYPNDVMSIKL